MKNHSSSSGGLTDQLKALLLGGALTVVATQSASAAAAPVETQESLDARIQSIRDKLKDEQNPQPGIREGSGPTAEGADLMWWRNIWGNGGWHNWHNGWHNWGNHWGNWHNI